LGYDAQLVGTGIFLRLLAQRVGVGLADQALHLAGIAGADRRCLGGLAGFVGRCLGGFGSLLGMGRGRILFIQRRCLAGGQPARPAAAGRRANGRESGTTS
jgi:hypothetical protein